MKNVAIKSDNIDVSFEYDRICLFFGANNSGKTKLLTKLAAGFDGNLDLFEINGIKVYKGDYKVIYLNEVMDVESELKLTKSNELRKLIYNNCIENIIDESGEELFLNKINEQIDLINKKINEFLGEYINNDNNSKIEIITKIDSIDKIIERFSDIFVDELNIKENKNAKSSLRTLLIRLLILLAKTSKNDNIIFLIDDIESFLSIESIIFIFKLINNIIKEKENIDFIITSSNNLVYRCIINILNEEKGIYKIKNDTLYNIGSIDNIIKNSIIQFEYNKANDGTTFESFYEQNEHLVLDNDIYEFKEKYFYPNLENIGILYVSNKCEIIEANEIKNTNNNYVIANSDLEKIFFQFISMHIGIDNN